MKIMRKSFFFSLLILLLLHRYCCLYRIKISSLFFIRNVYVQFKVRQHVFHTISWVSACVYVYVCAVWWTLFWELWGVRTTLLSPKFHRGFHVVTCTPSTHAYLSFVLMNMLQQNTRWWWRRGREAEKTIYPSSFAKMTLSFTFHQHI